MIISGDNISRISKKIMIIKLDTIRIFLALPFKTKGIKIIFNIKKYGIVPFEPPDRIQMDG
jgi:hypothetical protein